MSLAGEVEGGGGGFSTLSIEGGGVVVRACSCPDYSFPMGVRGSE